MEGVLKLIQQLSYYLKPTPIIIVKVKNSINKGKDEKLDNVALKYTFYIKFDFSNLYHEKRELNNFPL
jgi:hypothetical protein